jgi:hypothetical protein
MLRREAWRLTYSAPVMATILILFGIGYTIDYNSMSICIYNRTMDQADLSPSFTFNYSVIYVISCLASHPLEIDIFRKQCTSNTTRTEPTRGRSWMHRYKRVVWDALVQAQLRGRVEHSMRAFFLARSVWTSSLPGCGLALCPWPSYNGARQVSAPEGRRNRRIA